MDLIDLSSFRPTVAINSYLEVGHLAEALRLDPIGKAQAHLRLAALFNGAGMKDKAANEYQEFLKKQPSYKDRRRLEEYIKENLQQKISGQR